MSIYKVKVIARSSKCIVMDLGNNFLKIKLTKPALEGKANDQLCELLADYFKTIKSKVRIISGHHSVIKQIEIL